MRRLVACGTLVLASTMAVTASAATSDRLVVLGADGRSRFVQHTLTSEGAILRLVLPDGAEAGSVRFAGPERATFAEARRRSPGRVALWSGSALVRHRGERLPAPDAAGTFRRRIPSVPDGLSVADGALAVSRLTWVFPETVEIVAFTGGHGRWTMSGGVLTHEQADGEPATLEIAWRRRDPGPATGGDAASAARDAAPADGPDAAAVAGADTEAEPGGDTGADSATDIGADVEPDVDADGVPDVRDVCLALFGGADDPAPVDRFGCAEPAGGAADEDGELLVVDGIAFPAGKSYLDGEARAVLDRLARALLEGASDSVHEIAAHTDGAGSRARNLRLSERRAEAVRHYLMLRGVGPNRLHARGYGEAAPRADDATAAGRRANRRIELERIERR